MEAPLGALPTLLTILAEPVLEGIISSCMPSDVFVLIVSQSNHFAHAHSHVRGRRFFLRLEHGVWVYRDRLRGVVPR